MDCMHMHKGKVFPRLSPNRWCLLPLLASPINGDFSLQLHSEVQSCLSPYFQVLIGLQESTVPPMCENAQAVRGQ